LSLLSSIHAAHEDDDDDDDNNNNDLLFEFGVTKVTYIQGALCKELAELAHYEHLGHPAILTIWGSNQQGPGTPGIINI
jgi:hypothetical protein